MDSLILSGLDRHHIPGMVIVIVQDTTVLYARGYGYADVERKRPWSPDSTVIRIASVSKLFTGTAVMQLLDRGMVSMHQDVNTYLRKFQVEPWPGRPITLHHLLTHTAGFDDRYIGKSARTLDEVQPLGDFLARRLPPRIVEPGDVFTYSNFSNALAGFVVEEVTGEDFAVYVRRHVLEPIGMHRSDYRLRADLEPLLARSYTYEDGAFKSHPFDFINDYPGGQMLSTGADMARFMMAHLNLGEYAGGRILSDQAARTMHSPQFTHHARLAGAVGYSFGIGNARGQTTLQHDGGYTGVSSRLVLFPEKRVGIFMACNIMDGSLVDEVTPWLVERFFPPDPPDTTHYPRAVLPSYNGDVDPFVGTYRQSRYAHGSIEKCGILTGQTTNELEIRRNDEGMILMRTLTGTWRRMIQTEQGLFESIDDGYCCAFRRLAAGEVTHLFTNGTTAFEKIAWYEGVMFQRILFGVCMVMFAAIAILMPLVRRLRREKPAEDRREGLPQRPVRWFAEKSAGVFLLYVAALGFAMMILIPREEMMIGFGHGMHWSVYVAQTIALAGIILLAGLAGSLLCGWSGSPGKVRQAPVADRATGLLTLAVGTLFVWFLSTWNLIGYRF